MSGSKRNSLRVPSSSARVARYLAHYCVYYTLLRRPVSCVTSALSACLAASIAYSVEGSVPMDSCHMPEWLGQCFVQPKSKPLQIDKLQSYNHEKQGERFVYVVTG